MTENNKNPIIHCLPANDTGRDFVVGDLHGELDQLLALLKSVRFDKQHARLFSVGDLVDRGQDSMGCLALLNEPAGCKPWFFAVRGNHEDMLLDYLGLMFAGQRTRYPDEHPFTFNGGEWFTAQKTSEQERLANEMLSSRLPGLPHILVVGAHAGPRRFHVVHAELDGGSRTPCREHPGEPFLAIDAILDAGGGFPEDEFIPGFGEYGGYDLRLLWGREMVYALRDGHLADADEPFRKGLSPTFCGHTILKAPEAPLVFESHVHLDTGAFMSGGRLTMVEVGREDARRFTAVTTHG
ncbi:metallophosphoesterase [Acidithiobacillus ferridurans]|uniref:Metallophosphoesterase n=1 Tax=Acidithiobacillus ferridurans TaxID=1232575 RepID=A0A8X8GEB9_ACIFI|nr:metallophosphoesterase [Acidithiobacillus ferridurans]MBU2714581.1 metallophosphoesterase [Acidithiobacillus ferridurans]MBU2724797.1 metallophosphoesterase [Acidithiobacillus ferridurans]MBU2725849.1 metallophosphoesterase [Acidithiobacillus ferridurans]